MSTALSNDTETDVSDTLLERLRVATAGTYDIAGVLGRGGMAVVFVGEDLRLRRTVAIKVMEPSLSLIPGMAERFLEEARTLARLQHPNVIVVHDVQRSKGLNFFVMTLIEGGGVDELCHRTSPLPIDQAQWILLGASRALAFAHSERIVHRDVKPANILVNVKGDVILTDFGIAKGVDGTGLTKSGTQIGTPVYMSPEQFTGELVGPASDQYALGITAYQLLTGAPPFSGELYALIAAHGTRAPVPVRQLRPDCPAYLANAVMRMLEKLPQDRWPSLDDLSDVFGANLPNDGGAARRALASSARALHLERRNAVDALTAQPPMSPVPTNASRSGTGHTAPSRLVTVSPPRATIFVGGSLDLRASVTSERGDAEPDIIPTWSSNDPAIVTVDAMGRIAGLVPGIANVRASVDGGFSEAQITIESAPIARLSIPTPAFTMRVDDRAQPPVSAVDVTGSTRGDVALTWQSRSTQIADVESTGVVRALHPGKAVIEVSYGNLRQLIDVTVVRRPIARVLIRNVDQRLELGATRLLTVDAFDDRGVAVPAADLRWRSSAPGVIHIDSSGHALAIGQGVAQITAEIDQVTDSTEIFAVESPVAALELLLDRRSIEVDDELAVRLRVTDTTGGTRSAEGVRVWSSDAAVAIVDETRMIITAMSRGAVNIYAQAFSNGAPGVSTVMPFMVLAPATVRIDVTPSQLDLEEGATASMTVRPLDRRGRSVPDAFVLWASESPRVVGIGSDGVVRAHAVGSGMVCARVLNPDGPVIECRIPVLVRPSRAVIVVEPMPAPAVVSTAVPPLTASPPVASQAAAAAPPPLRAPKLTPTVPLLPAAPVHATAAASPVLHGAPMPVAGDAVSPTVRLTTSPGAPVESPMAALGRTGQRAILIGGVVIVAIGGIWALSSRSSDEAASTPVVPELSTNTAPVDSQPSSATNGSTGSGSTKPSEPQPQRQPPDRSEPPTQNVSRLPVLTARKTPDVAPPKLAETVLPAPQVRLGAPPTEQERVSVPPVVVTREQATPAAPVKEPGPVPAANTPARPEPVRPTEAVDASDLRTQADRFLSRLRSGSERNSELSEFFRDGADHKAVIVGSPSVVSDRAGRVEAQFEIRLTKFDGGGRRNTRFATVTMEIAKRDGTASTTSTTVGVLRAPR